MELDINATNAYRYNDNYQIVKKETGECVGVEHNQEDADAIARYLSDYHGNIYVVLENATDTVNRAKALRKDCVRVRYRDEILKAMD